MTITHEQKAAAGVSFVESLKHRIKIREEAQKRAAEAAKVLSYVLEDEDADEDTATPAALNPYVLKAVKRANLTGTVSSAGIGTEYLMGKRTPTSLRISMRGGAFLSLPIVEVPGLQAIVDKSAKAKELAGDLCQEVSHLHSMMAPARVASFQAHAARLWAPSSKAERLAGQELARLVDDFLAAGRPAICKVA